MIRARRIAGALGAEIGGVDLSKPLADKALGELRALWLEHLVVFFRDQDLSPKQFWPSRSRSASRSSTRS